jgi:hypothetical protein
MHLGSSLVIDVCIQASSFACEWAIRAASGNEANGNMVQA